MITSIVLVYLSIKEVNLLTKSFEKSFILFFFLSIVSHKISTIPLLAIKYIAKSNVSG